MLKIEPSARERIAALALTDGMAWAVPGGWGAGDLLHEHVPTLGEIEAAAAGQAVFRVERCVWRLEHLAAKPDL